MCVYRYCEINIKHQYSINMPTKNEFFRGHIAENYIILMYVSIYTERWIFHSLNVKSTTE